MDGSSEQLQREINTLMREVAQLQSELGVPSFFGASDALKEENERIEKYLTDIRNAQGGLITLAGLLTMMPMSDNGIQYFLAWVFPFLVISIFLLLISSKRVHFVAKDGPKIYDYGEVNILLRKVYRRSMFFHKAVDVSLVMFFFNFLVHYYMVSFSVTTEFWLSVSVTLTGLLLGVLRMWYISDFNKIKIVQNDFSDSYSGMDMKSSDYESMDDMDEEDIKK